MTAIAFAAAAVAAFVALCLIMFGAWLAQQRSGNSGWVDTTWSFGVGAVGFACALAPLQPGFPGSRQMTVAAMALGWSLRLGIHIAQRSAGIIDDPRYGAMAKEWGKNAPRRMFWFLQTQAWVAAPLALAIFLAAQNPAGWRVQDFLGVALFAIAVAGEAMADRQLRIFRADPRNKGLVCDAGLWRWSRHPNYFFEWLGWVAYPVLAIDWGGGYAVGYLSLAAPAIMYWLLVYVSGIPPLEQHMLASRGDAFRAYRDRTSAFFPLPPG